MVEGFRLWGLRFRFRALWFEIQDSCLLYGFQSYNAQRVPTPSIIVRFGGGGAWRINCRRTFLQFTITGGVSSLDEFGGGVHCLSEDFAGI